MYKPSNELDHFSRYLDKKSSQKDYFEFLNACPTSSIRMGKCVFTELFEQFPEKREYIQQKQEQLTGNNLQSIFHKLPKEMMNYALQVKEK